VVLNRTKEVWLKMTTVEPKQIDEVLDSIKDADKELTQVYTEYTIMED
jgi:hypothetical protein